MCVRNEVDLVPLACGDVRKERSGLRALGCEDVRKERSGLSTLGLRRCA